MRTFSVARAASIALLLAGAMLAGCSDSSGSESEDSSKGSAEEIDPNEFELSNREQFLARAPECEQMTAWFEANPLDQDSGAVARHLEVCDRLPSELADDRAVISELRSEVLASDLPADDPTRVVLYEVLGQEACDAFDGGERTPYGIALEIDDAGGSASDLAAALEVAVDLCPEHEADLTAFKKIDLVRAAQELAAFVKAEWPTVAPQLPELMAGAQLVCFDKRTHADPMATDFILESLISTGAAPAFRAYVEKKLCS